MLYWLLGKVASPSDASTPNSTLRFNSHFSGGPGLAGTRMSAFWILLELGMMEVVMTTGAIRRAKLQSKCHHQQSSTHFLQAG